jgi:hypothetical protein
LNQTVNKRRASARFFFSGEMNMAEATEKTTPVKLLYDVWAIRNGAERAWKGDWHRVASIPLNIAYGSGLVQAHSEGDDRSVKRFLNNPDNRAWRTKEGHL